MSCEKEEILGTISVNIVGCKEHGHFDVESTSVNVPEVVAFSFADATLQAIEHVLGRSLFVRNREYFEATYSSLGEEKQMSEETAQLLSREFAHQILKSRVAAAGYRSAVVRM